MERKTCRESGKIQHSSEERALTAATRQIGKDTSFLRAYKCPFCFYWHLTSKKR